MVGRSLGPVVAVAILSAACGATGTTARDVPEWSEPAAYEYALESSCGERNLIGSFLITVVDGEVADVVAGDERADVVVGEPELRAAVPTLAELLDEARAAEASGADVVSVDTNGEGDGRPGLIEIDHDTDTTDDEACYLITAYEDLTGSPTEPASTQPRSSGELPQLPPRDSWPVVVGDPPPCDDDGACADEILIGDVVYGRGCTRVRDEFVTDEALTDGRDAVHVIDGVDPLALVAQRGPAQSCDEFEETPDGLAWHMAFGPAELPESVVCRVGDLTERQVRANGC